MSRHCSPASPSPVATRWPACCGSCSPPSTPIETTTIRGGASDQCEHAAGPVYLIADGHPSHRAKAVSTYVASTGGRLKLFHLPGYSPELNPDGWVWKNVKNDRIARAGVTSKNDLKAKAIGALRRLQKLPALVRAFFADPHLRYITAA